MNRLALLTLAASLAGCTIGGALRPPNKPDAPLPQAQAPSLEPGHQVAAATQEAIQSADMLRALRERLNSDAATPVPEAAPVKPAEVETRVEPVAAQVKLYYVNAGGTAFHSRGCKWIRPGGRWLPLEEAVALASEHRACRACGTGGLD